MWGGGGCPLIRVCSLIRSNTVSVCSITNLYNTKSAMLNGTINIEQYKVVNIKAKSVQSYYYNTFQKNLMKSASNTFTSDL